MLLAIDKLFMIIWFRITIQTYLTEFFMSGLLLGLLLMGLVLCTYFKFRNVTGSARWKIFVLLLVFLASIYQRYNVSTFFYYCVLFGGAANLALSEPTEGEDAQGS